MNLTNIENQKYNEFMSKLIDKLFKVYCETQTDYNNLSTNVKLEIDNTFKQIYNCFEKAKNINDVMNFLNSFKK